MSANDKCVEMANTPGPRDVDGLNVQDLQGLQELSRPQADLAASHGREKLSGMYIYVLAVGFTAADLSLSLSPTR